MEPNLVVETLELLGYRKHEDVRLYHEYYIKNHEKGNRRYSLVVEKKEEDNLRIEAGSRLCHGRAVTERMAPIIEFPH
jgi:hypothetical protein